MVVEPQTGKIVGDVPNTPDVHGIAIAADLGNGFTSNGLDGNGCALRSLVAQDDSNVQTAAKVGDVTASDGAQIHRAIFRAIGEIAAREGAALE